MSDFLSDAGVDHLLVGGDPPTDRPRLGESLNEVSSPELWRRYHHDAGPCFFNKSHIGLLHGDSASLFLVGPRPGEPIAKSRLHLAHVDRIPFDRWLYDRCQHQSRCRFVNARVTAIDVRHANRVTNISLDDGTEIRQPRYVFDATGPAGLVARAAGIGMNYLSQPQRVVWTHFHRAPGNCPTVWWTHGTNLVRLDSACDDIDGIAWLIPLGEKLSVGLSVDTADAGEIDASALMDIFCAACQRRGIDFRAIFPQQRELQQLEHRYYLRQRGCGANWVLVGSSLLSIWFPSSAGVWTNTALAGMAAELIQRPRLARWYTAAMRRLLPFHELLREMVHGPLFADEQDVLRFWHRWGEMLPERQSTYHHIRRKSFGPVGSLYTHRHEADRLWRAMQRLEETKRRTCWHVVPVRDGQAAVFSDYFELDFFAGADSQPPSLSR